MALSFAAPVLSLIGRGVRGAGRCRAAFPHPDFMLLCAARLAPVASHLSPILIRLPPRVLVLEGGHLSSELSPFSLCFALDCISNSLKSQCLHCVLKQTRCLDHFFPPFDCRACHCTGVRVPDVHSHLEAIAGHLLVLSPVCVVLVPSLHIPNVRVREARERVFEVLNLTVS